MSETIEKARLLTQKRDEQAARFAKLKGASDNDKPGIAAEIKTADVELGTLHDAWVNARELEQSESRNADEMKALREVEPRMAHDSGNGPATKQEDDGIVRPPAGFKSLGEWFIKSDGYKAARGNRDKPLTVDVPGVTLKTAGALKAAGAVMTTSGGVLPYPTPTADVVPIARRRPTVADLMPSTSTDQPSVIYLEETTATNNAAPVAEGATKPMSGLVYTRRTVPLEVIAHYLPVTEQQLEDVNGVQDIINTELVAMLMLAEEDQLLNGTGASPEIMGIIAKTGVQTQAKGADDIFTAAMKAFTLVRHTGFADVSGGVMHPNDWLTYATAQDSLGRFLYGNPSDAVTPRLWGVPIIVTTAATENTGLFGDFALYARVWRKGGIRLANGLTNDDFIKNQMTLRCEERIALQIRRAAAFCKLTGI
jgi:HK97 family phage major capsid protein